jgi:hypothetical protein
LSAAAAPGPAAHGTPDAGELAFAEVEHLECLAFLGDSNAGQARYPARQLAAQAFAAQLIVGIRCVGHHVTQPARR